MSDTQQVDGAQGQIANSGCLGRFVRQFPIQTCGMLGCPKSIPWDLIAPHEAQAKTNHGGQTLERLAQRQGLSACEAVAVIEDRPWRRMEATDSVRRLVEWLNMPLINHPRCDNVPAT